MKLKSNMDVMIAIAKSKGYIKNKKHLAELMDVSREVLSRWINNHTMPSVYNLFKLAEILECKVDDLYERQ